MRTLKAILRTILILIVSLYALSFAEASPFKSHYPKKHITRVTTIRTIDCQSHRIRTGRETIALNAVIEALTMPAILLALAISGALALYGIIRQ
jgi:hypothetical protein